MALLLGVLCSGRKKGYTSALLSEVLAGAREVEGVEAEVIYAVDYRFRPCISCFDCIRDPEHVCSLDDDFGWRGDGVLFKRIKGANGLILASPVHNYGVSGLAHLVFERCYPFIWSDELNGIPFAGVTCASNQGMHLRAIEELCKFSFTYGMRWVDGLAVHTSFYKEALVKARVIGRRLAEEAKRDKAFGRVKFSDFERMKHYLGLPWSAFEWQLENLKMVEEAYRRGAFKKAKAIDFLGKALPHYKEASQYYKMGNYEESMKQLNIALSYWTHATWAEYLEEEVIKAIPPKVYRPL